MINELKKYSKQKLTQSQIIILLGVTVSLRRSLENESNMRNVMLENIYASQFNPIYPSHYPAQQQIPLPAWAAQVSNGLFNPTRQLSVGDQTTPTTFDVKVCEMFAALQTSNQKETKEQIDLLNEIETMLRSKLTLASESKPETK